MNAALGIIKTNASKCGALRNLAAPSLFLAGPFFGAPAAPRRSQAKLVAALVNMLEMFSKNAVIPVATESATFVKTLPSWAAAPEARASTAAAARTLRAEVCMSRCWRGRLSSRAAEVLVCVLPASAPGPPPKGKIRF